MCIGSHHSGPWDAARRCSIVGTPSYRALQDFKPRLTTNLLTNLLYPNAACAESSARAVGRLAILVARKRS